MFFSFVVFSFAVAALEEEEEGSTSSRLHSSPFTLVSSVLCAGLHMDVDGAEKTEEAEGAGRRGGARASTKGPRIGGPAQPRVRPRVAVEGSTVDRDLPRSSSHGGHEEI